MSRLSIAFLLSFVSLSSAYANSYTGSGNHSNAWWACFDAANLIGRKALPDPELNPEEKPRFLPSYSISVNKTYPTSSMTVCALSIDTSVANAPSVKQPTFSTEVRSTSDQGIIDAESKSMPDAIFACSQADSKYYEHFVKHFEPVHSENLDGYFSKGYASITRKITCALASISIRDDSELISYGDTETSACAENEKQVRANFAESCGREGLGLESIGHRNQRTSFRQSRGTWECSAIYEAVCKN